MVGELITLPVRIGLRAASLAVRGSLQATEQALALAGQVAKLMTPHEQSAPEQAHRRPAESRAAEPASAAPEPASAAPEPAPAAPERPPAAPPIIVEAEAEWEPTPVPPTHVSEEPALVESFAEPGAEDGAGAELHIDEPWEAYADTTAKELITRVADADAEELAAMQLYEATHRRRETVLSAVERALRIRTAGSAGG
jgi:hypothetical protein